MGMFLQNGGQLTQTDLAHCTTPVSNSGAAQSPIYQPSSSMTSSGRKIGFPYNFTLIAGNSRTTWCAVSSSIPIFLRPSSDAILRVWRCFRRRQDRNHLLDYLVICAKKYKITKLSLIICSCQILATMHGPAEASSGKFHLYMYLSMYWHARMHFTGYMSYVHVIFYRRSRLSDIPKPYPTDTNLRQRILLLLQCWSLSCVER